VRSCVALSRAMILHRADQASTRTTGQIGFGMTSASQHVVALIWALLLGFVFLGGIGWWWVGARRRRRWTPDLGILTALHQEREPERSGLLRPAQSLHLSSRADMHATRSPLKSPK
jgi:hypothetical protein